MKHALLWTLAALLLVLPAHAAPKDDLAKIAADYSQFRLDREPFLRLQRSLPVRDLPDITVEYFRQEADFYRGLVGRLDRVDPRSLDHDDWLTRAVLLWELKHAIEFADHLGVVPLVTPHGLPLGGIHEIFTRQAFASKDDLDLYLQLLRQYPRYVGQIRTTTAWQQSRGFLVPKETADQTAVLIRSYARPPETSLFAVAPDRLARIDPKDGERFRTEVARIVSAEINPALEALASWLAGDYRKAAPETVGLGQYGQAGGPEAYRFLVRLYTGLDVTPEEVHRIGLEAVARIDARMAELRKKVGFTGTRRQFHDSLRTDPRFLAKTPEDTEERLMAPIRRIEPLIGRYFLRLPKAPYGVKRLDPELEGSMTFGMYQVPTPVDPKGWYLYNGSKLDQRPLVNAAALIYHELLPGHHFQIAMQMENGSLPEFRRDLFHTAFVEGWGEYASELGLEMGLYDDPYSEYGRLAMDMFLSNRLVVDTGMNALGWPLERAREYMREHILESEVQIQSETLRYAVNKPGQALAYKMGSAKIWELRRRAEKELGERFDIRRFHEAVLGSGSLPLSVLEEHIGWWIGQEKLRDMSPRP